MTRYKITIEYVGTNYCGWQKQDDNIFQISIQSAIENAIYKFSFQNVLVYGAGRTDAGVHAIGQVAHFDLENKFYEPHVVKNAINHFLEKDGNDDIVITDCQIVENEFHARFSAIQRSYVYKIINRTDRLAILKNKAWHVSKDLDVDAMNNAAKYLIAKRDYSCFRSSACQANSPIITIDNAYIIESGDCIEFHISARSFLHHMVRNIMGTIKDIGSGKTSFDEFVKIIDSKDRNLAGPTAPACGLYFARVIY